MRSNRFLPLVACTIALLCTALFSITVAAKPIRHYVFYGMDRERLHADKLFLETRRFEGAQVAYSWRQLEQGKDNYEFSIIREDLEYLTRNGKRLWIQIQDVSFSDARVHVPRYIQSGPEYNGGIARQYQIKGDDESTALTQGWAARRWDPAVQARLHKLYQALAREFDGKIEGINLEETSLVFGHSGKFYPPGYTPDVYRDAVITNIRALRSAFKRSKAMIYANFMPGEWRPVASLNKGYLEAVYKAAVENDIAVGGPDLLPFRPGQLGTSYPLIKNASEKVTAGIAVQDGNYAEPDPKTGKPPTVPELVKFAADLLNVDYIFWCTEEPFYTRDVVPYFKSGK
jgi:hypothetical protein